MILENQKLTYFKHKILDFVRKAGREHLPWRKENITAYEVWVSEVMLQQTQVSRVIGYYEKFLKRFPTVRDLARASWEEFLPFYAGLGYYQRGRNMLATAQKVVDEYAREFPRNKDLLMKLPGIGDYTASAILSFAYDEPYLAYDTNLKRVMGRFFFGTRRAFDEGLVGVGRDAKSCVSTEGDKTDCCRDVPVARLYGTKQKDFFQQQFKKDTREMNAGLMDFGSSICTGRPKCATCPLATQCVYFAEGGEQEQRVAQEKKVGDGVNWKEAQVLVFLHEKHRKYFSAHEKRFEPFIVPASHQSRAGIKAYFRERYRLELAVRPPHEKTTIKKKSFLLVNAQILLGTPTFAVFPPEEAKNSLKTLKK